MPRQATEAGRLLREMYGTTPEGRFTPGKYQLMHIEMFPHHIIHPECIGGNVDLLRSTAAFAVCNRRAIIGFSQTCVALCRRRVVHRLCTL